MCRLLVSWGRLFIQLTSVAAVAVSVVTDGAPPAVNVDVCNILTVYVWVTVEAQEVMNVRRSFPQKCRVWLYLLVMPHILANKEPLRPEQLITFVVFFSFIIRVFTILQCN